MRVVYRNSFEKDVRKLGDAAVRRKVREAIQTVVDADRLSDVPNLKKLVGTRNFYRIRVGDYRLGLALIDEVVVFVRCLHRRDIYRRFPSV